MSYNPFSLENKVILITGASSGIGRAIAVECSKLGATIIASGRNEQRLYETLEMLAGSGHSTLVADFNNEDDLERITDIAGLDGLVHSAGILETLPFSFTTPKKLSSIMKVNFEIPFSITQQLLKKKKLNKESSIVFISSLSGYSTVASGISAYSASKGAICASVRVMALELAPKKIRVNAVCPGMVKTEMNTENSTLTNEQLLKDEFANYPLGYGSAEDVAQSVVFLLSGASKWITGSNLVLDGGASIH